MNRIREPYSKFMPDNVFLILKWAHHSRQLWECIWIAIPGVYLFMHGRIQNKLEESSNYSYMAWPTYVASFLRYTGMPYWSKGRASRARVGLRHFCFENKNFTKVGENIYASWIDGNYECNSCMDVQSLLPQSVFLLHHGKCLFLNFFPRNFHFSSQCWVSRTSDFMDSRIFKHGVRIEPETGTNIRRYQLIALIGQNDLSGIMRKYSRLAGQKRYNEAWYSLTVLNKWWTDFALCQVWIYCHFKHTHSSQPVKRCLNHQCRGLSWQIPGENCLDSHALEVPKQSPLKDF